MLSHADGDSTLITSAPISARRNVANGPAHIIVRSSTRIPSSGSAVAWVFATVSVANPANPAAVDDDDGFGVLSQANPGKGRPGIRTDFPYEGTMSQNPRSAGVWPASTSAGVITKPNGTLDFTESSRISAIV